MEHATNRRGFLKLVAGLIGGLASAKVAESAALEPGRVARGCLEIVSVQPGRAHLVSPGSTTTFVVALTNPSLVQGTATVLARSESQGWMARISEADHLFQAVGQEQEELAFSPVGHEKRHFLVKLGPDRDQLEGNIGTAEISATIEGQPSGSVILRARVHSAPKVYFVAYDGLGRDCVGLDRRGEYDDVETDPLMPNLRRFMGDSACVLKGLSQMPALTDPNHVSILTGSWPGTLGLLSVAIGYFGLDDEGNPVTKPLDSSALAWGSTGEAVRSVFHVAKDLSMGGDPGAMNAMILGKGWIGDYFKDDQQTVDVIATGLAYPDYLPAPDPYVLGDPRSDGNADTDRDGWNLYPLSDFRRIPKPPTGTIGDHPSHRPDDRWVVEGALRIIAAEDPDVLYILPSNMDYVQHHTGTADQPQEWNHGRNAAVLWDDFHAFNLHANREPALDVVREADVLLGLLVLALRARGNYDDSIVVLTSDHGLVTMMDEYLRPRDVIQDAGIPEEAFDQFTSIGDNALIWLSEPSWSDDIESALEGFTVYHPIFQQEVHPFLVMNRDEMDTGVDGVLGRIGADGGPKRGELYSEWCIDYPVPDNSKQVWPDLIVHSMYHYQMEYTTRTPQVGSHGGPGWGQRIPLAIRGPGINKGFYGNDRAYLVDIAPTLYHLLGWEAPANVDGRIMTEILSSI